MQELITNSITEFQKAQIPIFKKLIKENCFFKDFNIVTEEQYVGIEKKYDSFWVYIEIEDAKTMSEINGYEVWFNEHEQAWFPSNEKEEDESYPKKHSFFDNFQDLKKLITNLNDNNLIIVNELMDKNPRF